MNAAIYARVSTNEQDPQRQIEDCRETLDERDSEYETVDVYTDIQTGTTGDRREFKELQDEIVSGEYDVVVCSEVSRFSREGSQAVMEFITLCLDNDCSVEFVQNPINIDAADDPVTNAVNRIITSLLSELAQFEQQQKLERINSGIRAAQKASKWTSRPPRGFSVGDDGRLHVDPEEFLNVRHALERIASGESKRQVAEDSGTPRSTLTHLYNDEERRQMYLEGDHEDDRTDSAIVEFGPLPELDIDETDELEENNARS
ncbi:recombinase family protein [Natronolimnohabitans sp. A-GB9]|uniref:recombinase family protein n=1 Tax=Natronolimnohabitans sp. A-GB9 TaxID=3069757 RepID=UPI0027ADD9C4|nr:recombinase family protein [Natronolimnohabitans sp. A-GB9]MDQ2051716.1 recombinase family protein [Natronolimnohabitans sp. A-GB9]